jgi:hypothetical protein
MSIQHEDALQIHKFAHISPTDPGAVGAGKAWVDTSEGEPYKFWIRNTGNTAWIAVGLGNSAYGIYGGHALRQMEANSIPPYDVPAGMIMALYTNEVAWRPITTGEMRLMLGIYNVPDGDARPRSTHTGTQLASTISNFNSAVDERISTTLLKETCIVSGAGSTDVNGLYTARGTYNSHNYYNLEGASSNPFVSSVVFYGHHWRIYNGSGDEAYTMLAADVDNPVDGGYLDQAADPMLIGFPPAPTVTFAGLNTVREDFVAPSSGSGSILRFREGTLGGTSFVSIQAPNSLASSKAYYIPYTSTEDGSPMELLTTNGIQDVTSKTIYNRANLITNNTCNGSGISGRNAGAALAQWQAVYIGPSSTWLLADANGTGTYPAWGLATAAVLSGNTANVLTKGTVRNDAWTWTPNGAIYLSTTAGGLTQTAPATTGDKVQIVGRAITATIAYFDFNSIYTTV